MDIFNWFTTKLKSMRVKFHFSLKIYIKIG